MSFRRLFTPDEENFIALFFSDPLKTQNEESYKNYDIRSFLYILRSDARKCLEKPNRAIWPASMVVLSGIDLLGQYSNVRGYTQLHDYFKEFCKVYLDATDDQSEGLFRLRNALFHRYGLFSESLSGKTKYEFTMRYDENDTLFVVKKKNTEMNKYIINLYSLHDRFEKGIEKYRLDLLGKNNGDLAQKFLANFDVNGVMKYSTAGSALLLDFEEIKGLSFEP